MRYFTSILFLFLCFAGASQVKTGTYLIRNDSSAAVSLTLTADFKFTYYDVRSGGVHYLYVEHCGKWSLNNDTLILNHKYLEKKEHPDTAVKFTDCDGSVYTIKNAIEITELKKYIYKNDDLFYIDRNKSDSTKWGNFDFSLEKHF
ncbi:MAG TPA: hypothetical protein VIH86_00160 [Puia sp.]